MSDFAALGLVAGPVAQLLQTFAELHTVVASWTKELTLVVFESTIGTIVATMLTQRCTDTGTLSWHLDSCHGLVPRPWWEPRPHRAQEKARCQTDLLVA